MIDVWRNLDWYEAVDEAIRLLWAGLTVMGPEHTEMREDVNSSFSKSAASISQPAADCADLKPDSLQRLT